MALEDDNKVIASVSNTRLGFNELKNMVIDRGLCTSCGTCIGACPRQCLTLSYGEDEEPVVVESSRCISCGVCTTVCPGADIPMLDLERFVFGRSRTRDEDLGIFLRHGSSIATDEETRQHAGSGGLVSALLIYALESGFIDCAIIAGFSKENPWRPEATIATNRDEIIAAARSKYSATSTNVLLHQAVKQGYKKIGVAGCPCHIHGLRKIQYFKTPPELAHAIKLCLGLFCGNQTYFEGTRHFLYEWWGIKKLEDIATLEYRGGPWPEDNFVVTLRNGEQRKVPRLQRGMAGGGGWGRDRCMMCLDFASELADVSVGDYSGPARSPEERRRSVFLARTKIGDDLMKEAESRGAIASDPAELCWFKIGGGYEEKKHSTAFRYLQRQKHGWPTPNYHFLLNYAPTDEIEAIIPLRKSRLAENR
jgi:coenzyme F420 hydrogenase subunit beta